MTKKLVVLALLASVFLGACSIANHADPSDIHVGKYDLCVYNLKVVSHISDSLAVASCKDVTLSDNDRSKSTAQSAAEAEKNKKPVFVPAASVAPFSVCNTGNCSTPVNAGVVGIGSVVGTGMQGGCGNCSSPVQQTSTRTQQTSTPTKPKGG